MTPRLDEEISSLKDDIATLRGAILLLVESLQADIGNRTVSFYDTST